MSIQDRIKRQLIPTIPKDYELEFDICMKCGRRLPDKKYSTWKSHQNELHKQTRKEAYKTFFYKHPLFCIYGIMFTIIPILLITIPIIDQYIAQPIGAQVIPLIYSSLGIPEPDTSFYLSEEKQTECFEASINLKKLLYEDGDFSNAEVTEFNRLLHECNLDWSIYSQQLPIFKNDYYKTET